MGLIQTLSFVAPERKPDVELKLRKQLQDYDRLLNIMWVENVVWNEQWKKFEGRYALVCHWPDNDPRRELFRKQEVDVDYDILGWFGENPQDATIPSDPEKFWNRMVEILGEIDNTRNPVKDRLRRIAEQNKLLKQKKKQDFLEGVVHDDASYNRTRNLGNVIVNVPKEIK